MVNLQDSREIKWCTVNLSDVFRRGGRLEASVFDVEAKKARYIIEHSKYGFCPLGGENGLIKKAFYPGRFKRIYCDKKGGLEFFLPSQLADIYPKPEKYISRLTKCDVNALRLMEKSLLLTRSGTIGTVSLVSKTTKNLVFSDDVIRVSFKNETDLGYVYSFVKSKVGNLILTTTGYGSVITHIEPEHLENLPIPNPPMEIKEKINCLIVKSFGLRDESNKLIDEATRLLIDELKLPPIENFDLDLYDKNASVETYCVKLSNLKGRIDGSYHVPVVQAIINCLNANAAEVTKVGDVRISKEVILPGRFKRVYVDEGFGRVFIGGKQIGELDPTNKKYLSIKKHGDRISKQLELHENMTLITCSGTIGKVALVGKHWEKWTANQHIIRVVPAAIDVAGYLNIFLASDYGHALITRYTYGSVVDEIDDRHVRDIPFPLLKDKAVQNKINKMALEANQKRYEAYLAEQEALRIMNDEVIFAGED